jgi:hypothetical protein
MRALAGSRATISGISGISGVFGLAAALMFAFAPSPLRAETAARLENLRIEIEGGRVHLFVRASSGIDPRVHWLPQTGRELFVVDLPGVRLGSASLARRPGAPILYAAAAQWRSSPPVVRLALHFPKRVPVHLVRRDSEFEWIIGEAAPTTTTPSASEAAAPALTSPSPAAPPLSPPAPNWRDRRVTLSFRDASLPDVLRAIGEQNAVSILIHPEITGAVSVYLESVRLEDALHSILAAHSYTFRVERDLITVLPARLDFTSYRVWFLKTPGGGTLPDLLRDLVPPPSRLFYYRDANAIVLFAAAPSVAELVEAALAELDRGAAGN